MHTRFIALIAALLLSAAITSCRTVPFTLAPGSADVTEIPLDVSDHDIIVTLNINGVDVPVQIDLGGNSTIALSPQMLENVAPRLTGGTSRYYDAYGNKYAAREYVLDSVRLGSLVLNGVKGSEFLSMQEMRGAAANGYVGIAVLERFNLLFDYPAHKLYLLNGNALPPGYDLKNWARQPFDSPSVVTTQPVDGMLRTFLWDTGATFSIIKPAGIDSTHVRSLGAHDLYEPKALGFGSMTINDAAFVVLDIKYPDPDGLIGHNFFQEHPVYINWQTSMIYVR